MDTDLLIYFAFFSLVSIPLVALIIFVGIYCRQIKRLKRVLKKLKMKYDSEFERDRLIQASNRQNQLQRFLIVFFLNSKICF